MIGSSSAMSAFFSVSRMQANAGDLERHFGRVDVVVAAVLQSHPHTDDFAFDTAVPSRELSWKPCVTRGAMNSAECGLR